MFSVAIALIAATILSAPVVLPEQQVQAAANNYFLYDDYLEVDDFNATSIKQTSMKLKWRKTYLADGYQIYRYNTSTKKWKKLTTTKKTSYTVKGLKAGTIYRFKIRAYDTVNNKKVYGEWEKESFVTKAKTSKKITAEKAKSIALSHAKVSKNDVWYIECETDYEYGTKIYEVEFEVGGWEYSYEINANTGKIISWEIDD